MKILSITAQYPPFHMGGYEIRVKNILDGLFTRGHDFQVLTNIPDIHKQAQVQPSNFPIIRKLHNRLKAKFFPNEILFDLLDTRMLARFIADFKPDVIYLGHIYILSKALLPYLASLDIPIIFDEGGNGLKGAWTEHGRWFHFTGDWQSRFPLFNFIKPWVIYLVCKLSEGRIKQEWIWPNNMQIIFNSELNKKNACSFGVPVENANVIHSGVNTQVFSFRPRETFSTPLKILIPGRIEENKGQLDGLKLLRVLNENNISSELWIVGPIGNPSYYATLLEEVEKQQFHNQVKFFPMLDREKLVDLYHQADICFFPSYQKPGLSRVPLEAMACGSIVISYGNEGSDEIITNGKNGYLISPGDMDKIKFIIINLSNDPTMYKGILSNACGLINSSFSLARYVDKIESFILSGINN